MLAVLPAALALVLSPPSGALALARGTPWRRRGRTAPGFTAAYAAAPARACPPGRRPAQGIGMWVSMRREPLPERDAYFYFPAFINLAAAAEPARGG